MIHSLASDKISYQDIKLVTPSNLISNIRRFSKESLKEANLSDRIAEVHPSILTLIKFCKLGKASEPPLSLET
jgi:hypothetical protein